MCFMRDAMEYAKTAYDKGEVPVGAVLVHEKKIIARAHNQSEQETCALSHAEMLVMKMAMAKLGQKVLPECDLYVTLEPCAMCAGAISWARIRRLYFAAQDPKSGGVIHGSQVFNHSHHKPEVYEGIMADEARALMQSFFRERRK